MAAIDHLIVGCSDLEIGIQTLERMTGVCATRGGKHPKWGTHNALLSLGARIYLEILAPDPDAPAVSGHLGVVAAQFHEPKLFTWAASVSNIEEIDARLRAVGLGTSGVSEGSRERPDGSFLRWKSLKITSITDPAIPFLIEWDAASSHPSADSPQGCILEEFTILHPDAKRMREIFHELGIEPGVVEAPVPQLRAILKTPSRQIELR